MSKASPLPVECTPKVPYRPCPGWGCVGECPIGSACWDEGYELPECDWCGDHHDSDQCPHQAYVDCMGEDHEVEDDGVNIPF